MHVDHCALDDVGGGPLHGCIDCAALRVLTHRRVARFDFRQVQAPAIDGFDEARFTRQRARLVHVTLHAGITLEIQVDIFLRIAAADAELPRQAKGRHAVNKSEVDRLGRAPLVRSDPIERSGKNFRCSRLVDIAILGEGGEQARIPGQVRHDAQLDLRIVRRDQLGPGPCHKGLTDAPPFRSTDRDVLKIRIGG